MDIRCEDKNDSFIGASIVEGGAKEMSDKDNDDGEELHPDHMINSTRSCTVEIFNDVEYSDLSDDDESDSEDEEEEILANLGVRQLLQLMVVEKSMRDDEEKNGSYLFSLAAMKLAQDNRRKIIWQQSLVMLAIIAMLD